MIKTLVAFSALLGLACAMKKPGLSLAVRDGSFQDVGGLDPTVSWEDSTHSGDFDFEYGAKVSVRPSTDVSSMPKSMWGKAKTAVAGWGTFSALAKVDGDDLKHANVAVDAENDHGDVKVHMEGRAGTDFHVSKMQATKSFDAGNRGRFSITPRVDFDVDSRDVVLDYHDPQDRTQVKLTMSANEQQVTLSQQLDDENRVAPTVNSHGDVSLEWEHRISDDHSVLTKLKPGDSLNVEWRDDAWTANVNFPMQGKSFDGAANVSIKRDVSFF